MGGQHKGAVGFYKVVRSHTKRCQDLQPHAVQTKTVCDEGELWCEPGQIVSSLWRRGENKETYWESPRRVLGTGSGEGALGHTDSAG